MPPSPIQKIMVCLDASASSLNALQTAVDLAARIKAIIQGLFVEDINLLHLASLPFAREICFYSSQSREVKLPEIELQLRVQAERIRRTFIEIAEKAGASWEFQNVRGTVAGEILAAGTSADLVVLGKIGRSLSGIRRSGSTVRQLLLQRRGMTLIMETCVKFLQTPVTAVYNGTESGQKTLDTAVYLAQSHDAPLTVIIVGNNDTDIKQKIRQIEEHLKYSGIIVVFRPLIRPTISELSAYIRHETKGPVVLPNMEDLFEGEELCCLVEEIDNPVLLIR
jgi:nucleotide-binding universal stress UspA family protein